jgi:hypothetical protein
MQRTRTLQNEVDSLSYSATCAELQLRNTFNKLLMLSNTQVRRMQPSSQRAVAMHCLSALLTLCICLRIIFR